MQAAKQTGRQPNKKTGSLAGKQPNKKHIYIYGETTIYIEQQEWLRPEGELFVKQFGVKTELSLRYQ